MRGGWRTVAIRIGLLLVLTVAGPAWAQKPGGILKMQHWDSPASMSIHEEATYSVVVPMMGVMNNLVMYKQDVPQNSQQSIIPDLAESWSWDDDSTRLTFKLRAGVKWHDGKPFTANDVKCTWDLLRGEGGERLRLNPRKEWWQNVDRVTADSNLEATFQLTRPQPALLTLLASGYSPIYTCHVPPAQMRQRPIGTGPFKFVDFKPNEYIKVARNPDYWKPGRPYLDGVEYTIIPNRSTAILGFIAGKFDMTFPYEVTIPLLKDIKTQAPQAICEVGMASKTIGILVKRTVEPFDNPDLRRAMALTLDRKSFIDILGQGEGEIGGALMPPPDGVWGMPPAMVETLPGYTGDLQKNRDEARALIQKAGYGPDKRLPVKISTRNLAVYRDPAAILIDQLKEIGIDGELETVETAQWVPKLMRKDYKVGLNVLGTAVDDPDVYFYQNYVCSSARNYMGYCDKEFDRMVDQQSMEADPAKRKKLVWDIDHKLQEDLARPVIYHLRAATCWQPEVKGLTMMTNSQYNGWRFEDVWLDK